MSNLTDITIEIDDLISHGKVSTWEQILTHLDLWHRPKMGEKEFEYATKVIYYWYDSKYVNKGLT